MALKLKNFKIVNYYSPEQSTMFDQMIHVEFEKSWFFVFKKSIEFHVFRKNMAISDPSRNNRAFAECEQRMFSYCLEDGTILTEDYKNLILRHVHSLIENAKFQEDKYKRKNEIEKLLRNG